MSISVIGDEDFGALVGGNVWRIAASITRILNEYREDGADPIEVVNGVSSAFGSAIISLAIMAGIPVEELARDIYNEALQNIIEASKRIDTAYVFPMVN
jgi:hypothetical protein